MPFRFLDMTTEPRRVLAGRIAALTVAAMVAAAAPVAAQQQCPDWQITGSVTPADATTIPSGTIQLFIMLPGGQQAVHFGHHPAPGQITLSGPGGSAGNVEYPGFFAIGSGYFHSLVGGGMSCTQEPGAMCGSCSGNFDLKLYASQGAIEGRLTVAAEAGRPAPRGHACGSRERPRANRVP